MDGEKKRVIRNLQCTPARGRDWNLTTPVFPLSILFLTHEYSTSCCCLTAHRVILSVLTCLCNDAAAHLCVLQSTRSTRSPGFLQISATLNPSAAGHSTRSRVAVSTVAAQLPTARKSLPSWLKQKHQGLPALPGGICRGSHRLSWPFAPCLFYQSTVTLHFSRNNFWDLMRYLRQSVGIFGMFCRAFA